MSAKVGVDEWKLVCHGRFFVSKRRVAPQDDLLSFYPNIFCLGEKTRGFLLTFWPIWYKLIG
jgi:hypothetical protein